MTTNNRWLNSTYLLIREERREKQRRERQNKNWRAKSEEDSCGKIYAAPGNLFTYSWSWQSFNLLFALDLQKEIQRLSRLFCYSWLACLLGFWLRNAPLWQKVIGNHRFHKKGSVSNPLTHPARRSRKGWSDSGLTSLLSLAASRPVSLNNLYIAFDVCFFFRFLHKLRTFNL